MHSLLLWAVLYFTIAYLVLPLLIFTQQKMAAHPQFLIPDLTALTPEVTDFLYGAARELETEGFAEPTFVVMPNQVPNVTAYLVMLINRTTGDKAMVTVMFSTAQGRTALTTRYVEFSTRYENDQVFDTLNSKTLSSFQPSPKDFKTRVPSVQDIHVLYRLHQRVMSRHALGGPKVMYAHGEAIPYISSAMIKSYDQQVKYGILKMDIKSDAYRPTLKGTYLMTWGLLWPVKIIRTLLMERQEQAVLRAFPDAVQTTLPINR